MARPLVWLDLAMGDVEEHKRKIQLYQQASTFCSQYGPRYGLPADVALLDSGGRELLEEACTRGCGGRVQQPLVWVDPGPLVAGRVVLELYADLVPKAAENFRCLCTGERGVGRGSKKPLHYQGCRFHRIVTGFCCQGGDIIKGDGSSGDSIYGGRFNDEKAGLKLAHDGAGVCAMANSGKNSNTSQFFITLGAAPQCDGKHVVFGKVVDGFALLERIGAEAASESGIPRVAVTIVDCGQL